MEFGTYIWAQPPHTVQLSYSRKAEHTPDGNGGWSVNDLGRMGCVIDAEGSFSGPYAHEYFNGLAKLFEAGNPAQFVMPPYASMMALMTELSVIEEPCENFLRYRFRLLQTPTTSA